jgi:hypothetical protein
MPLEAPIMDVNRQHLQQRGQLVLEFVARLLREAGIQAKLKLALVQGRQTLVVATPQSSEAFLTIPPVLAGHNVLVI